MKDGRTHLAYKAEHAVDVISEVIVAAEVWSGTEPDTQSLVETVATAQRQARAAGSGTTYVGVVADKGYYSLEGLAHLKATGLRTSIPEPRVCGRRRWGNKPEAWREAAWGNRRRVRGDWGRRLNRLRSERVERSFAHVCKTGRARRTWLRGRLDVSKRYLIQVAARNLGTILRKLFGVGTPRGWAEAAAALCAWLLALARILSRSALLIRFLCSLVLERACEALMPQRRYDRPISPGC